MKTILFLILLTVVAGCSTHPKADTWGELTASEVTAFSNYVVEVANRPMPEPETPFVEKMRRREGTNFLGVYMGMIAKWDGSTTVCEPERDANGHIIFGGRWRIIPHGKPEGVMMFSATSGELLRWIAYQEFREVYVLKLRPEYPQKYPEP